VYHAIVSVQKTNSPVIIFFTAPFQHRIYFNNSWWFTLTGGLGVDGVTSCVIEEEFAYACTGIGTALEGNGLAVCINTMCPLLCILTFQMIDISILNSLPNKFLHKTGLVLSFLYSN